MLGQVESAGVFDDDCADTPGTRSTDKWKLPSNSRLSAFDRELVFCLIPKDEVPGVPRRDPGRRLPRANGEEYRRVDCGSGAAQYRVLERSDSTLLGIDSVCGRVRGAPMGISRDTGA